MDTYSKLCSSNVWGGYKEDGSDWSTHSGQKRLHIHVNQPLHTALHSLNRYSDSPRLTMQEKGRASSQRLCGSGRPERPDQSAHFRESCSFRCPFLWAGTACTPPPPLDPAAPSRRRLAAAACSPPRLNVWGPALIRFPSVCVARPKEHEPRVGGRSLPEQPDRCPLPPPRRLSPQIRRGGLDV